MTTKWYAAHLINYFDFLDEPKCNFLAWEDIVLVEANSDDEAEKKAWELGEDRIVNDDNTRIDGRMVVQKFLGVRKIIECSPSFDLETGTEISFSQFRIRDIESAKKLAEGQEVDLKYVD